MNRTWITAGVGVVLLTGCTLAGRYGNPPRIPVGSELTVHQRLPLETDDARVFVQDGTVVSRTDINRFRVSCAITLRRRGEEPLVTAVRPGRFIAIEGSRSWARPRQGSADDHELIDPPSRLDYVTALEIRSDLQPQVDGLRCRYNGHRTTDHAPGPADIRTALGNLATLKLPDEPRQSGMH